MLKKEARKMQMLKSDAIIKRLKGNNQRLKGNYKSPDLTFIVGHDFPNFLRPV